MGRTRKHCEGHAKHKKAANEKVKNSRAVTGVVTLFKHFSGRPRPHGLPRQGDNFIATHYSLLEGKPATWSVCSDDGDDPGERLSGQRGVSPVLNSGC